MIVLTFLLAAMVQTISSQGLLSNLPKECTRPPRNASLPHECCKIPPFFPENDFLECGFQKVTENTPPPRRHGPPDCTMQLCLLKKYDLVDGDAVSKDKVSAFMEKWAETNSAFKPGMELAKAECIGPQLPGPPTLCEANKIVYCATSVLFSQCPNWEQTEGCKRLKEHMDLCAPYFQQGRQKT